MPWDGGRTLNILKWGPDITVVAGWRTEDGIYEVILTTHLLAERFMLFIYFEDQEHLMVCL